MKASLVLKMGQQLTMTPQLQQAIRLLQMSTLDLQDEIREALESNPMLERQEDAEADGHASEADPLAEAAENHETSEKNPNLKNRRRLSMLTAAKTPPTWSASPTSWL